MTKKIFTVSKEVEVNCPNGVLKFKCTDTETTEHFNIGLYSMAENKFILCTEDCDGSSNYIRKLEGGEPIQKFNLDEFQMLDYEANSE